MTDSNHDRISDIFLAICDLPEQEMRSELMRLCDGDEFVQSEVEQLLGFDAVKGSIDTPVHDGELAAEAAVARAPSPPPERLGEYEILGILGEGGMGVVYRARKQQPDRVIALKVLRRALMRPQHLHRFEYEANVLGRLQHPGIAQIYDFGRHETTLGARPYFAMELVEGAPITDYANEQELDLAARLALIVKLCDALQYAHEQGVIHRDLKPANVLVSDRGEPKILDFGVSRAVDRADDVSSMRTETGVLVGTLAYMSPEQLTGDHDRVDTRSDIYALGVLLFELVTGELPFPIKGEPAHVAARTVLETEPIRAGTFNTSARGDVEVIAQHALAREKSDRYASASELGADISRHLHGEAIEARRGHAWYVLKKSIRRHRVAVGVTALFVAMLTGALIIALGLYRDSVRANGVALAKSAEAEDARDKERLQRYSAEMMLGFTAFAAGDLERVRRIVDDQRPQPGSTDVRGFEWHWLDAISRRSSATIPAHLSTVRAIEVTPNGERILTAGWDCALRMWDAETRELLASRSDHARSINALAVSPDGRLVASAGWDREVIVWELEDLREVARFTEIDHVPMALAFSADSAKIAVGSVALPVGWTPTMTSQTRLWPVTPRGALQEFDLANGALLWSDEQEPQGVTALCYGTDDSLIAGRIRGDLLVFDPGRVAGDTVERRKIETSATILWDIALDPSRGEILTAGGGWDERPPIEVWNAESGDRIAYLSGHASGATSVRVSRDGTRAFSSGWDQAVIEWNLETRSQGKRYLGSTAQLCTLALREGAREVLAGGFDGQLHAWSMGTAFLERRLPQDRDEKFNAACFSPAGHEVISIANRGFLQVLDAATLDQKVQAKGHYRPVRALAFHPGGEWFASGGLAGEIRTWNTATGEMIDEWQGHTSEIWDLAFTPNGDALFSAAGKWHGQGELINWDTRSGTATSFSTAEMNEAERAGQMLRSVDVSPDGAMVAVAKNVNYRPGLVELFDVTTMQSIGRLVGHDREVNAVEFHPTQPIVATGDVGGSLRLWDLDSLECYVVRPAHGTEITALAFTRDGRTLASGGVDGTVHLWEPTLGHPVGTLDARDNNLWTLEFNATGDSLCAAMDQSLTLWDVPPVAAGDRLKPARLYALKHPSASGTAEAARIQLQLSSTVSAQGGLDSRWYELAAEIATTWASLEPDNTDWVEALAQARSHTRATGTGHGAR